MSNERACRIRVTHRNPIDAIEINKCLSDAKAHTFSRDFLYVFVCPTEYAYSGFSVSEITHAVIILNANTNTQRFAHTTKKVCAFRHTDNVSEFYSRAAHASFKWRLLSAYGESLTLSTAPPFLYACVVWQRPVALALIHVVCAAVKRIIMVFCSLCYQEV